MGAAEKREGEIGFLLPALSALDRGSMVVHGAILERLPIPPRGPEDYIIYPAKTALCGVEGWGEGGRRVTCKNCLRIMHARAAQ